VLTNFGYSSSARRRRPGLRLAVAGVVAFGVLGAGTVVPAASSPTTASVSFIQALYGSHWTASVNGKSIIRELGFNDLRGPRYYPAGTFDFSLTSKDDNGRDATLADNISLGSGENATIAVVPDAHHDASLVVFANPLSRITSHDGRFIVRQLATIAKVDVVLNRHTSSPLFNAMLPCDNGEKNSEDREIDDRATSA